MVQHPPPTSSEPPAGRPVRDRLWARAYELSTRHRWLGAALGLALVALLVPLLSAAGGSGGSLGPSIPLFFLVPMLLASTLGGRIAGLVVSVAAVAAWDWFFIPPLHMVTIDSPRDILALAVFACDALLTGQLAGVARRRAEDALRRARTSEALYDLSVTLIGSHDLPAILPALTQRLRETFDLRASAILLPVSPRAGWRLAAVAGTLPDALNLERSRNIAGVLSWVESTGEMCTLGPGTDGGSERRAGRPGVPARLRPPPREAALPGGADYRAQFWPLRAGAHLVGVLELVFSATAELDAARDRLLATLVNGAAIALEQERLEREEREAAVARESDRLKSALLSSVSHDLRTPLAGIKAAASSLLQDDVAWGEEDRRAFAADIDAEADRLARLVSNLLDLSRIEAGALRPQREWDDVTELVERVVRRLRPRFPAHPIAFEPAAELPAAAFDAVHIEQALTNLIENAARYSPDGAPVTVAIRLVPASDGPGELHVAVADRGPGITPAERAKIFAPFYRVAGSGRRAAGTGLGLAIVRGLVEANGGRVEVTSTPGEGSVFTLVLPVADRSGGEDAPDGADRAALELPAR